METDLFCERPVVKSKNAKENVGNCLAKAPNWSRGSKGNRLLSNFVMKRKTCKSRARYLHVCQLQLSLGTSNGQFKCLQHISVKVLGVLNTTADADKVIVNTGGLTLLPRDTSVGHAGGNLAETLDTTQTLSQGEDLSVLAEAVGSLLAALDAEAEHTAAHAVAVLLEGNSALRVGVKTGVVDGDNVGRRLEGLGHNGGVLSGLTSTQVQGLQTTVSEPAVEGRGNGTNGVLEESEALLQGLRVESGDTHQHIGVTVDVLGDGVHDDIGTMGERVLNIGTHEGVIDNNQDAMAVGDVGDSADVHQAQSGVGGCLNPDQLGLVGADQFLHLLLNGGRKGHINTVVIGDLGEVAVGATVHVGDRDDVGPGSQGLQDDCSGCGAGRESKGIFAVLNSGNSSLEVIPALDVSIV